MISIFIFQLQRNLKSFDLSLFQENIPDDFPDAYNPIDSRPMGDHSEAVESTSNTKNCEVLNECGEAVGSTSNTKNCEALNECVEAVKSLELDGQCAFTDEDNWNLYDSISGETTSKSLHNPVACSTPINTSIVCFSVLCSYLLNWWWYYSSLV